MSKTSQKHAGYSVYHLLKNSSLSFQTNKNYQDILKNCIKNLDDLGYILRDINQLKQKHISALVDYWKDQYLNAGTIKNKMSALRYACRTLNKRNVIFSNDEYSIDKRSYQPKQSKAVKDISLEKIKDPYIKLSLALQEAFGLRREECIKFNPSVADKGDKIELKGSWTKGGIQRVIPITTQAQRKILNEAKQLCGQFSLIPTEKTFIEQRHLYDNLTHQAGLYNLHGLRHAYAQKRYFELTNYLTDNHGWASPLAGGKSRKEFTKLERNIDMKVREMISRELGHSRAAILKIYIG